MSFFDWNDLSAMRPRNALWALGILAGVLLLVFSLLLETPFTSADGSSDKSSSATNEAKKKAGLQKSEKQKAGTSRRTVTENGAPVDALNLWEIPIHVFEGIDVPVPFAKVTVMNPDDNRVLESIMTDSLGRGLIHVPNTKKVTLEARKETLVKRETLVPKDLSSFLVDGVLYIKLPDGWATILIEVLSTHAISSTQFFCILRELAFPIPWISGSVSHIGLNERGIALAEDTPFRLTGKVRINIPRPVHLAFCNQDGFILFQQALDPPLKRGEVRHISFDLDDFEVLGAIEFFLLPTFNINPARDPQYKMTVYLGGREVLRKAYDFTTDHAMVRLPRSGDYEFLFWGGSFAPVLWKTSGSNRPLEMHVRLLVDRSGTILAPIPDGKESGPFTGSLEFEGGRKLVRARGAKETDKPGYVVFKEGIGSLIDRFTFGNVVYAVHVEADSTVILGSRESPAIKELEFCEAKFLFYDTRANGATVWFKFFKDGIFVDSMNAKFGYSGSVHEGNLIWVFKRKLPRGLISVQVIEEDGTTTSVTGENNCKDPFEVRVFH